MTEQSHDEPLAGATAAHGAAATAAEMTPSELAEAKHYGRLQLVADLGDKALDVVLLALLAFLAAVPLDAWLAERVSSATLRLLALMVIVMAVHVCVSFPLSFYSGHVLEHRFALSTRRSAAGCGDM